MMILTNKAKLDFYKFIYPDYDDLEFYELIFGALPESFKIAQITEWLDSIGIIIIVSHISGLERQEWSYDLKDYKHPEYMKKHIGEIYTSREITSKKAIEKANEIYNSRP